MANLDDAERTRWRNATVGAVALLVFSNVMANRVIANWMYVPWNVSVAVALIWIGLHEVTREQMGFTQWRRGLLWGGTLFGATALVLLIGLALPATHGMFDDKRVTDSVWAWLYHAFLRIPVGTAFMEETAFRAVLPALFAVRWGVLRGCIAASVLFGCWHVLPSLGLHNANPTITDVLGTGAVGTTATVALAVAGTALAGLVWCWIRYRSGSVLTTMIGHVATNSVAYTIAFWVNR